MGAANCAAVLLSVPISYHFHGCTALLVALVVVSGAILNTHLYLYLLPTLKTLGSFVFELCCGQTDTQTDADERFTPATSVGLSYKYIAIDDDKDDMLPSSLTG